VNTSYCSKSCRHHHCRNNSRQQKLRLFNLIRMWDDNIWRKGALALLKPLNNNNNTSVETCKNECFFFFFISGRLEANPFSWTTCGVDGNSALLFDEVSPCASPGAQTARSVDVGSEISQDNWLFCWDLDSAPVLSVVFHSRIHAIRSLAYNSTRNFSLESWYERCRCNLRVPVCWDSIRVSRFVLFCSVLFCLRARLFRLLFFW